MLSFIRRHAETVVVATIAGMIAGGGALALAHDADGGGHDQFAHQAAKIKKIHYRRSQAVTINIDSFAATVVNCPGGTRVVGGGLVGTVQGVSIVSMNPSNGGFNDAGFTSMAFNAFNSSSAQRTYRAYVMCIKSLGQNANYSAGDPTV